MTKDSSRHTSKGPSKRRTFTNTPQGTIKIFTKPAKTTFRGVGVSKLKSKRRDCLRLIEGIENGKLSFSDENALANAKAKLASIDVEILEAEKSNQQASKLATPARNKSIKYDKTWLAARSRLLRKKLTYMLITPRVNDDEATIRNELADITEKRLYVQHYPSTQPYYGLKHKLNAKEQNKQQTIMADILKQQGYQRPTFRMSTSWVEGSDDIHEQYDEVYFDADCDDNNNDDDTSMADMNALGLLQQDTQQQRDVKLEIPDNAITSTTKSNKSNKKATTTTKKEEDPSIITVKKQIPTTVSKKKGKSTTDNEQESKQQQQQNDDYGAPMVAAGLNNDEGQYDSIWGNPQSNNNVSDDDIGITLKPILGRKTKPTTRSKDSGSRTKRKM